MTNQLDPLFEAGWLDDEAEEICAYARDTGLTVAEVERLAKLCLRADTPVSYRALRLHHLTWFREQVEAALERPSADDCWPGTTINGAA